MSTRMELLIDPPRRGGGAGPAVVVSLVLHSLLLAFFYRSWQPAAKAPEQAPMARYVELMRQQPSQQFTEAPGPKVDSAPLDAPFSDANRRASAPDATGDTPTNRPGDGSGLYTPPSGGQPQQPMPPQQQQQQQEAREAAGQTQATSPFSLGGELRAPAQGAAAAQQQQQQRAQPAIDWRSAIRGVGSSGAAAGPIDISGVGGGEPGSAEAGPLSFETQWYDWGPYAQSMVSKLRVNWYANMPQIIRTGLKGVVTIRFTIQRDGRITDITTIESSGIPPYDFAARKAIELSSPLNPLPKDFPNNSERVTCMFYYNMGVGEGRR